METSSKIDLFDNYFQATVQQEDYFQARMVSKLNLKIKDAFIFRFLLRNHAYSPNLKMVWIGKSKHAVKPEPFQLSTHQAAIAKMIGCSKPLVTRTFKRLVEVGILEFKKTASGHERYFLNTVYCQNLLEEWEIEDGLDNGEKNYTLSTFNNVQKERVFKERKEALDYKASNAPTSESQFEPTTNTPKEYKEVEEVPKIIEEEVKAVKRSRKSKRTNIVTFTEDLDVAECMRIQAEKELEEELNMCVEERG